MTFLETFSSWVMISFTLLGIICALIFIVTVIRHRRSHTTTNLLVFNTAVAGLLSGTIAGSQAIYQLVTDKEDYLCQFRGYLMFCASGFLYHTLCVQAIHRLFIIVLSTRRDLQSKKTIIGIVIIQWTISALFPLPVFLTKRLRYNPGSRICSVGFDRFFSKILTPTDESLLSNSLVQFAGKSIDPTRGRDFKLIVSSDTSEGRFHR